MDKKHSSDDNDDNSSELNESEDSNQYHHSTTSHNFEDPKSENSDDEGSDEGTEEEGHDFWSLLTQETARKMHNDRLAADLPGPDEAIQDVYQLVEGKKLSIVMNHLKNRYRDIKEISEAANSDTLLGLIEKKAAKVEEQYEEANEDISKEAEDIAWRKYKFLVKKKIIDNIEHFQILVGGDTESDTDEESEKMSN